MTQKTVAIVGASADRSTFGNKAVRAHLRAGWTVYPVHPQAQEVEGLPVLGSLDAVPGGQVDRVAVYVRPSIGLGLLPAIALVQPQEVIFNPGTANTAVLKEAAELGLPVRQTCSILDVGFTPGDFPDE